MTGVRKVLTAVGFGVAVGAIALGYYFFDRWWNTSTRTAVRVVVLLDDGAVLSIDDVVTERRHKDRDTGERETTTTTTYQLRRFDAATGRELATRASDSVPTCAAAVDGRAWCLWGTALHLVGTDLATIADARALAKGPLAVGFRVDELRVDDTGGVRVLGLDGVPARIDARTTEATPIVSSAKAPHLLPRPMVVERARLGEASYELARIKGQERRALRVSGRGKPRTLAPEHSYLEAGFLVGRDGAALAIDGGGLLIVHRATLAKDAPYRLTRVDHAGAPAWTAALPGPLVTAAARDGMLDVLTPAHVTGIALADGAVRYTTPLAR